MVFIKQHRPRTPFLSTTLLAGLICPGQKEVYHLHMGDRMTREFLLDSLLNCLMKNIKQLEMKLRKRRTNGPSHVAFVLCDFSNLYSRVFGTTELVS